MIAFFVIKIILLVLTLLVIVPAATNGNVAIRHGGLVRGLFVLFVIACLNNILWLLIIFATAGGIIPANWFTFGWLAILVNALAFKAVSKIAPNTLNVSSFGSAIFAALIMTIASLLINRLL
jgi:uncharacterized membrane protein YvlD (DUF360 family)